LNALFFLVIILRSFVVYPAIQDKIILPAKQNNIKVVSALFTH